MESFTETISLTFGDCGENHVGMDKLGNIVKKGEGFNLNDLNKYKKIFENYGNKCYIYNLKDQLRNTIENDILNNIEDAYLLVIKNGLNTLLSKNNSNLHQLYNQLTSLEWDRKYFDIRRNKVLNKHARANLCFNDYNLEPDYQNKQGRVVSYQNIPLLKHIKDELSCIDEKMNNLICEGNRYFNLKKCGIGYHGDAERRKVIAFRIGHSMDLHYSWFCKNDHIGETLKLNLQNSDMYIMSEKAVGNDWKKRNIYTLRHAAGIENSKYLKIK